MSGSKILAAFLLAAVAVASPGAPMIVAKPDGTFAIHKETGKGNSSAPTAKAGLTIPPQIVVPIFTPGR